MVYEEAWHEILQRRLHIVRYRLRKMSEVTRLDLDDPDRRLAVIIALLAG